MSNSTDLFNMPRPSSHARLPALDGLRGVAILMVMLCHYTESARHPVFTLTQGGWWGVDLFFVLSGFLVTGILLDARDTPHALRNFYARRTLRIFPLYYGFLALCLIVLPALKPAEQLGLEPAIRSQAWLWSYTTNVAQALSGDWIFNTGRLRMHHFWSLAVEEQFYLAWPWLVLYASRRTIVRVCVVAMAAAPLLRGTLLLCGANPLAALVLAPCRLDALAAGAVLATIARESGGKKALRSLGRKLLIGAVATLSMLGCWRGDPFNLADPVVIAIVPSALAALFTAAVAFAATSSGDTVAYRLCTVPLLRGLGTISYGLYVFHLPVLSFVGRWAGPGVLSAGLGSEFAGVLAFCVVGISLSCAVAAGSWIFFEGPVLKLKRHFKHNPAGRRSGARAGWGSACSAPAPRATLAVTFNARICGIARWHTSDSDMDGWFTKL
jgi:peptidoglycan/LPS O-acetylase OafA/YrhL